MNNTDTPPLRISPAAHRLSLWPMLKLRYLLALALALIVAIHYLALPKITARSVLRTNTMEQQPILLPHMSPDVAIPGAHKETLGTYEYTFTIEYASYQEPRFTFFPIGCIEQMQMNGADIPLPTRNTCSLSPGFILNLAPYLHDGENTLTVKLSNIRTYRGSRIYDTSTYGLHVAPKLFNVYNPKPVDMLVWALIFTGMLIVIRTAWNVTGDWIAGLILSVGLWFYLRHFVVTNFMQYTIDMPSHLQYIIYIARHNAWPPIHAGWEYYHPPLYYHLQAWIMRYVNWLGSFDSISVIRAFSLACYMVFQFICALILRRIVTVRPIYYAGLAMMVFYPMGMVYATRIDSHMLYYPLYAACTFFLLRWVQENRLKDAWLALIMFGIALGVRSNALILAPLIAGAVLYQWRRQSFGLRNLLSAGMLAGCAVILLGAAENFGRTAYFRAYENSRMPYVVGNIDSIQRNQAVVTSMKNLLVPDTQQLFTPPFIDWYNDYTGRQHFWNAMLKTSLFEHFTWSNPRLAKELLVLMVSLTGYLLISLCVQTVEKRKEWRMAAITLLVPIAMLMVNRVIHPYAPSQDFRYIFPSLISFIALLGLCMEQQFKRQHYVLMTLALGAMTAFSVISILFVKSG